MTLKEREQRKLLAQREIVLCEWEGGETGTPKHQQVLFTLRKVGASPLLSHRLLLWRYTSSKNTVSLLF